MDSVTWLDDAGAASREGLGGKGASLAALMAAGFAVPEGFVLPPSLAESVAAGDKQAAEAVLAAYRRLAPGDEPVAVRSSATDEDGDTRSFAGQHLTVLDVRGEEALLTAIADCVASLTNESAASYRGGAGAGGARMAVVVQRMLQPEAAGVAFSVDPVSGDPTRVVVEAVAGFGEALVSGLAEAERWVFGRKGLSVLEHHSSTFSDLTDSQARDAASAVLRCERLFGAPQDIEFAFQGGKLWLLQSRAITAAGVVGDGIRSEFDTPTTDADLWTSANVGEVLPGLLTPLTMTAFANNADRAYCIGYQRLKMLDRDEWPKFVGFFANRAFLHVGNTRLIAERAFGSSGDAIEHRYLGGEIKTKARRENSLRNWKHRFLSAIPLLRMTRGIHKAGERIERDTLAMERRIRAIDVSALADVEIDSWRLRIEDLVGETFAVHLQASGCAGAGFDIISRFIRPVLKAETEGRMPLLFTGLDGVESAEISRGLWEVSRLAFELDLGAALTRPGFDPHDPALPRAWRQTFAAFLERHGHRGVNEMEPAQPSWRQDPAPVVAMAAAYLGLSDQQSPPATFARQRQARLALTAEIEAHMNRLVRPIFRSLLRDAQSWVARREQTKSVIVRGTRLVEYLLPEASRRLAARGVVAEPDDLFFITGPELSRVLGGEQLDLTTTVVRRRREMERNRYFVLPERFSGRPVPLPRAAPGEGVRILTGTPVSPGCVTGRARVILDPRRDGPIQPGEILVAPVTDAGWTPLFALAAGLVVDIGSALSHGSTVAREYGLPAVVNVRTGTTTIRTGDLVTVDGAAGTVEVIELARVEGKRIKSEPRA